MGKIDKTVFVAAVIAALLVGTYPPLRFVICFALGWLIGPCFLGMRN